jgi:hypothetical protein
MNRNAPPQNEPARLRRRIKKLLIFFIGSLVASGLTAFPIESQLILAEKLFHQLEWNTAFTRWIEIVSKGVSETNLKFPFIAYGTDWLAFAHLVIALAFIGPIRDPVKNIWVVQFSMMACIAVLPLAFIAGHVRDIPVFWRMIDCLFGILGGYILFRCHSAIKQLEKLNVKS